MNVSSAYMVDSLSLWHNRFGHVNIRRLNDMANLELIPKHENDMYEKCKVCAQTKITRIHFPKIEKHLLYCIQFIVMYVICIVILLKVVKNIF